MLGLVGEVTVTRMVGEGFLVRGTLLYSVSGMDTVDAGTVKLDGVDLTALSPDELADNRRRQLASCSNNRRCYATWICSRTSR